MAKRHTISYLNQLLGENQTRTKKRFGQNFLIDGNLIDRIVQAADLTPDDAVLEVGTGVGTLSVHLAERCGQLVTVEVDREMASIAQGELEQYDNVRLLCCDAMQGKQAVAPEVVAAIEAAAAAVSGSWKLVANLPYNIATPLMASLLELSRPPSLMVATIQWELACRLAAEPGGGDYGAVTVWVQSQSEVRILRKLPPSVFYPPPAVHSAFIEIVPRAELRSRISQPPRFQRFVQQLFLQRRKQMVSRLVAAASELNPGGTYDAQWSVKMLSAAGIASTARPEECSVSQLIELFQSLGDGQ